MGVTVMSKCCWISLDANVSYLLGGPELNGDQGEVMLEEKAKELGRLIGQSSEYQTLKRSSEALNEDREAVKLLQEMERLRGEAQQLIQRGENPTPEMEKQLDDMLEKIQVQPAYQRAVSSQENFDKIMMRVNQWIMDGMKKGAASPIITLS
jgi:cell fate (sporulation/competence/biofilm development) regulator YlbF (YheA/YmcA/DUF963 family)